MGNAQKSKHIDINARNFVRVVLIDALLTKSEGINDDIFPMSLSEEQLTS